VSVILAVGRVPEIILGREHYISGSVYIILLLLLYLFLYLFLYLILFLLLLLQTCQITCTVDYGQHHSCQNPPPLLLLLDPLPPPLPSPPSADLSNLV